jgi:CTP:molybdopterin cytidylyltransferase MocA
MKAAGLITVAGQSLRMHAFKPLLPINGTPMIARTAGVFSQAGITDLFIVIGKRGEEIISALDGFPAQFLWNNAFEETQMFASFQIGLNAIHREGIFDAVFLLPGDMPAVEPGVLRSLQNEMEAGGWDVVFPSTGKRRLHPPLIHKRLFDALIAYSGEDGLRGAFRSLEANIGYVVTKEAGCLLDVDTPEDYAHVQQYMKEKPEGEA